MIVVTTETVPGHEVTEVIDIVQGSTVRTRGIGRDIMAGLRTIVGGEVREYAELLTTARSEALNRMVAEAEKMGADAVVQVRYNTANVMQGHGGTAGLWDGGSSEALGARAYAASWRSGQRRSGAWSDCS